MNSMHNSFGGPGGYVTPYPGYVPPPPSALPYYNGYLPSELGQNNNPYYGKNTTAVAPGYASTMSNYTAPINNSSMYYQQYGLGYQYGYGKYGTGYSSEIPSGPGIHPPSIGTLQAPTTDLGLTGSMFSKNNKFSSGQGSSSTHTSGIGLGPANSAMLSPATPNTPSPGPNNIPGNLRGGSGATPSPPVEQNDAKKDLEKMKRCPTCGQIFRLMSECLAHMKTVHESPLNVYNLQHSSASHMPPQSLSSSSSLTQHSLASNLGPPTSRHGGMGAPDSPLMALERMGWGEKQSLIPLQTSPSPLTPYTPASTISNQQNLHLQHNQQPGSSSAQAQTSSTYVSPPISSALRQSTNSPSRYSPLQQCLTPHNDLSENLAPPSNHRTPVISEGISSERQSLIANSTSLPSESLRNASGEECQSNMKQRKANSYSVSSIIGESFDKGDAQRNLTSPETPSDNLGGKYESIDIQSNYRTLSGNNEEEAAVNLSASNEKTDSSNEYEDALKNSSQNHQESEFNEKKESCTEIDENSFQNLSQDNQGRKHDNSNVPEHVSTSQFENLQSGSSADNTLQDDLNSNSTHSALEEKETLDDLPQNDVHGEEEHDLQSGLAAENLPEDNCEIDLSLQSQENKQVSIDPQKTTSISHPQESIETKDDDGVDESSKDSVDPISKCNESEASEVQSDAKDISSLYQQPSQQQFTHPQRPLSQQPSQQPNQTLPPQNQPQQISSPQHHSMFHNQNNVKQQPPYSNWSMQMSPNYSNQYPYASGQVSNSQTGSPSQPPQNSAPGSPICNKPHVYPPVQSRYPSQYHSSGIGGNSYAPHDHVHPPQASQNFTQSHLQGHSQSPGHPNHPQANWFPPNSRPDSKAIWNSWPNQGNQSFPQGFYGYPGSSHLHSQKHHVQHSGPPPAHVHPSHSPHLHNIPHQPATSNSYHKQSMQQSNVQQHISHQSQIHSHHASPQPPSHAQNFTVSTGPDQQSISELNQSQIKSGHYSEKSDAEEDISTLPMLDKEVNGKSDNLSDAIDSSEKFQDNGENSSNENELPISKKAVHKIGPKSRIFALKNAVLSEEYDSYKCSLQEHSSLNGYGSQSSAGTGGLQSCESSDSEVASEEGPTFTLLRPAKRKSKDGTFVGPKRIKLAKQVRERQERRQKHIREKMRQTELEEQLLAQRVELANDLHGPLANILLQSSILLADKKVEGSESVEECIAFLKAESQTSSLSESCSDSSDDRINFASMNTNSNSKRPGRKTQIKVFHNENSVIIKELPIIHPLRKLRAKDFKWSHYIKSMRYWCNDCAQGFKNQKEAGFHTEERCKWNCLYMLECYVVVDDIQNHPQYGSKVQELLEEYQIDGQHHCTTCGDIVARKADFLVHVDSHKDFNPWECTICGSRFKIRGSLKEHLRYTHMKGRVPCLKCNKVFPTSTLLRQHVKVHTQHYKYKSAKNREEELRAAMEATAGALEAPPKTISQEETEKMSYEANEYRNWCKLMEMNALKNLGTSGSSGIYPLEEDEEKMEGDDSFSSDDVRVAGTPLGLESSRIYPIQDIGNDPLHGILNPNS